MSSTDPSSSTAPTNGNAAANGSIQQQPEEPARPASPQIPDDVLNASIDEIRTRTRLLDNDLKVIKSEQMRLNHEQNSMRQSIKENADKIRQSKQLPFLCSNVVEVSGRGPTRAVTATTSSD